MAARIADQILATVVTESDQPLRDAVGEDATALVREDLALSVAALLGDKQAQIENRRINAHFDTMRKIVTEMEDVEKGRFYSATIYDGNTLRAIPNMIRAALKTSRAFTGSIRNTLAKVKDWYCAEDNAMMYKPIPGEHNEGMTDGQIVFDKDIAAMLEELTTDTGKLSIKAKLESDTSTEGYRKQAQFWRDEHGKAVEYHKRLNTLKYELEKLANQKKGLYVNAANFRGDSFKVAIDELAKMNWRGGLVSAGKIREHFAKLAAWYTKENPLYKGDGGTASLFKQEIADALNSLGNSQNV
ncbi:MAG: hypothetical protein IKM08_07935 [Clostridia bacterium]|nr:hypothetical protein [Clostridia bacterium]